MQAAHSNSKLPQKRKTRIAPERAYPRGRFRGATQRHGGDPRELHYYMNGLAVGDVTNNGTSDVDYAAGIAEHTRVPGSGPFRDGASSPTSYADFDENYDPIKA